MLTEMLRVRYRIPAANCVTHAQVSVNPSNMRIGYHVDWASEFPFEELGLPDRYAAALPSIWAFGFEVDGSFRTVAGAELRAGIDKERGSRRKTPLPPACGRPPIESGWNSSIGANWPRVRPGPKMCINLRR